MLRKFRFVASLILTVALAALASPLSGLPTTINNAGALGAALAAPATGADAMEVNITSAKYLGRQSNGEHRFRVSWEEGAIPTGMRITLTHVLVRAEFVGTSTTTIGDAVVDPSTRTAVMTAHNVGDASVRGFTAKVIVKLEGHADSEKQFRP